MLGPGTRREDRVPDPARRPRGPGTDLRRLKDPVADLRGGLKMSLREVA